MSLDRSINTGKEKRRPYYGSQLFDYSCRPHGSCPWCLRNRMHKRRVGEQSADEAIREAAKAGGDDAVS